MLSKKSTLPGQECNNSENRPYINWKLSNMLFHFQPKHRSHGCSYYPNISKIIYFFHCIYRSTVYDKIKRHFAYIHLKMWDCFILVKQHPKVQCFTKDVNLNIHLFWYATHASHVSLFVKLVVEKTLLNLHLNSWLSLFIYLVAKSKSLSSYHCVILFSLF